jgi:trimethylamine:corrinoid methyltransferase-like protein
MPSSRPENADRNQGRKGREARNFTQLGLDFTPAPEYSNLPGKETDTMNHELFEALEAKVVDLLEKYRALKEENTRLAEENGRFQAERDAFRSRIDRILGKLDGI